MGSHIIEVESSGGFKLYTPIYAKDGTQYQLARREILKATKGKTVHELRQLGYFESWEAARASVNRPEGNVQSPGFDRCINDCQKCKVA